MTELEMVYTVSPAAVKRGRRLAFAAQQLMAGQGRATVEALVKARYGVSRVTAWRIVCMAADIAGRVEKVGGRDGS